MTGALFVSNELWAQACCAGGATLTPGRLERHEWLLVGSQLQVRQLQGSYSSTEEYHGSPEAASQRDAELQLFSTVRLAERVQFGGLLPLTGSARSAPGLEPEWGGGVGDVEASLRWDALFTNELAPLPGVALLTSGRAPTGTAPESAVNPLGSDVTSTGAAQATLAVVVEDYYDAWLATLMVTGTHHFARHVQGVTAQRGAELGLVGSVAYAVSHRLLVGAILSVRWERPVQVDQEELSGSDKRATDVGLLATYSPNNEWRLRAGLTLSPPLDGLGRNELAKIGGNIALIRRFW